MYNQQARNILEALAAGELTLEEAERQLASAPFVDLGFAKPDTARALRQGASEVIYGAGKTAEQIALIVRELACAGQEHILITRTAPEKYRELEGLLSDGKRANYRYFEDAELICYGSFPEVDGNGYVLVMCAGTSDLYCAEEAALTAQMLGSRVVRAYDVGVAGLERLLAHLDDIQGASAIVAVAGMEGALASVVSGLARTPVIAVPTSVGYGASFEGLAALLSMLNACASGVSVVNIDNGFGAGYQAALIDHA